jgi:hypothetical protein
MLSDNALSFLRRTRRESVFAGSTFFGPLLVAGAAFVGCQLGGQSAFAASINYGTFPGDTVTYVDVSEDSASGDDLPLFGEPDVTGDSLDFDPIGFDANATGPGGSDTTASKLTFMVVAKPDFVINNINLSESGDTTLSGFGDDTTSTGVTADIVVEILEIDGAAIAGPSLNTALTFSPTGGMYGLLTDGGGGPTFNTIWEGSLLVDVKNLLDNAVANNLIDPYGAGATKIGITIDNTLSATSQVGTFAVIAKKDAGGISITVNMPNPGGGPEVPEPASLALAMVGLLALVATRRIGH